MATSMTNLWLFTLLVPLSELHAQVAAPRADTIKINVRKGLSESYMNGQIKHVSDFINRFNASTSDNAGGMRMFELFNEDDQRLSVSGRIHDAYGYKVNLFIQTVTEKHTKMPKRGPVTAKIGLKVGYNGTLDTLTVHLRKDYTADSAAYWHVTRVIAPAQLPEEKLNTRKSHSAENKVELPPNAHEVSFVPLLRGLDDYQSLAPFTPCLECRDAAWRKVENALQSGRMTAEAVVSNKIYLAAGDWEIELSEFIREKENSGWLISDLIEKNAVMK
ncbi:hypothetical protein [Dyadobacter jiangsuensis]|uniref:Uncharacterized protein n=1 Tax=Dyadobacter jiangsuensis TaxID=1591085 RepID=A0A2P8GB70_9BACT|nr:hypothetical protein [Dyadobacter jiangsuensis]PSL31216.1 hypothetical protein CLV60_10382 [Dyadobacter jiangsuensis]